MRTIRWLDLSALVASLTVFAIAFVLVPDKTWSAAAITSVTLFAFSVASVFYLPSFTLKNNGGNNAAQMASLGPIGFLAGGMLLLTVSGFVSALMGWDKAAWIVDIIAFGAYLISQFMLRATCEIVGNVASQYSGSGKHTVWQSKVQELCGMATDASIKVELERLAEKLRFSASGVPGGTPHDSHVSSEIQILANLLGSDNTAILQNNISRIEMLIAQREVFLRRARNKT